MAKLLISLDGVPVGERAIDKQRLSIGRRAGNDIVLDHIGVSGEHAVLVSVLNDTYLEDLQSTNGTTVNGAGVDRQLLRHGDCIEIGQHRLQYLGAVAPLRQAADFEKTMVINRLPGKARPVPREGPGAMAWHAGLHEAPELAVMARERPAGPMPSPMAADPATGTLRAAGMPPAASPGGFPILPSDAIAELEAQAARQAAAALAQAAAIARPAPLAGARLQVLNGNAAGRILVISKPLSTIGRPGSQVVVLSRRGDGYYLAQVDGAEPARLNGSALAPRAVALGAHDVLEVAGVKMEFFFAP